MSESKFTPGPWYIKHRDVIRTHRNGADYSRTTILDTPSGAYKRRHVIAQIARGNGREETNAALIAAAPEMYECVCDALTDLEMSEGMRAHFEKVLKKARGEE